MEPALDRWHSADFRRRSFAPQLMNTSFATAPNRTRPTDRRTGGAAPVTDYSYHAPAASTAATASKSQKHRVELTNFRALSRGFFGAEAGREYIKEAIVFVWMMVIAAWPLAMTLNMLGTMMISPPPWFPNQPF